MRIAGDSGNTEVSDVQDFCGVELGGFEPPTSWVRFGAAATNNSCRKQLISRYFTCIVEPTERQIPSQICVDMRRCDRSRELLARSSRNHGGRFKMADLLMRKTSGQGP
jgi:hypothetical protein